MATIEVLRTLAPQMEFVELDDGRIAAVVDDMEVVDPFMSTCGRLYVAPMEAYGMTMDVALRLSCHNRAHGS